MTNTKLVTNGHDDDSSDNKMTTTSGHTQQNGGAIALMTKDVSQGADKHSDAKAMLYKYIFKVYFINV